GDVLVPAMLKIHQQEREIVEDVDRGDVVREFDAVEQQRLPLDETDVAQVQVAVHSAYLAGIAPLVEQRADPRQLGGDGGFGAVDLRCGKAGRTAGTQHGDI